MVLIDGVLGNINSDNELKAKYNQFMESGETEFVVINRLESEKVRMRKKTDKGTDLIMNFSPGTKLRHEDVIFMDDKRIIVIQLAPENVIVVRLRDDIPSEKLVRTCIILGHTIGNLHRPIEVLGRGKEVCFPIQAESELDTFKSLLHPIENFVEIKPSKMVFEPEKEMHVHEH